MVELIEGSGVFWYTQQRAYCSAVKNWSSYVNAVVDIFFNKEKLASSCAMGNQKKSKTSDSHQPLNPLIVHAIIGRFNYTFLTINYFYKVAIILRVIKGIRCNSSVI